MCVIINRARGTEAIAHPLESKHLISSELPTLGLKRHVRAPVLPLAQVGNGQVTVGRAVLPRGDRRWAAEALAGSGASSTKQGLFSCTASAMRMLQRVAVALQQNEPLLLVGETGTGKTTMVQQLAQATGTELVVLNLSQQTDSSDLLGGFRPVEVRRAVQ